MLANLLVATVGLVGIASADWVHCEDLVQTAVSGLDYSINSAVWYAAGSTITLEGAQTVCQSTAYTEVDVCRVTFSVYTSDSSETYGEIWLPNQYYDTTDWNGRIFAGGNGGLNGCVNFDDLRYATAKGFVGVNDNGGHNGTVGDGSAFLNNNEVVLDWSYRAKHVAIVMAKAVTEYYYSEAASYSYYVSCSTGGRQGMKASQMYPDDYNGIIAGSAASDFNHHIDWTGRFVLLTGTDSSDPKFLTQDEWSLVHDAVLAQCDEPLDGVADGFLEDSTICNFDASVLECNSTNTDNCLSSTQITTVNNIYTQLYDQNGLLLYPRLSPGAELQSFELGPLSGSIQGTSSGWFANAVWNNSAWDSLSLTQTDYTEADATDVLHGNVSSYDGDLSELQAAGAKLITYHGSDDPLIAGEQSQRYYLHVAATMGLAAADLDDFYRFYRVSGLSHCGLEANGAWAFGQTLGARNSTFNIIDAMVDWVENDVAPDYLIGTRWVNGDVDEGVEFQRKHCRFPYRATYNGGDSNDYDSWSCDAIDNWQECGPGSTPRLCGGDGTSDIGL